MKASMKKLLAKILRHIFSNASYNPGDLIKWEDWMGGGFITSGAQDVYFGLPLQKPINGNVQIQTALYIVRQNGNYVLGSGAGSTDGTSKTIEYFRSDSMICLRYRHPSALPSATNNDAVGIQARVVIAVT